MISTLLDVIFLPAIFFIGLVTSYQDFHYGKIKNKWILLGSIWGIGIWLLLLVWSQSAPALSLVYQRQFDYIPPVYILEVFVNSFIAFFVGYAIWYFDLWSAGDAKLFFVFSLLLPLKYYWRSTLPYFPSAVLLINVFVLALIFFTLKSLFLLINDLIKLSFQSERKAGIIRRAQEYLKTNYRTLLKTALIFFVALFIFQAIRYRIGLGSAMEQTNKWYFIILFLLLSRASKYIKRLLKNIWPVVFLCIVTIAYLWLDGTFDSWGELHIFFQIIKKSLKFGLLFSMLYPLLAYANKKEGSIQIPFALWLFLGAILTMLLKGSLISLISDYKNYMHLLSR